MAVLNYALATVLMVAAAVILVGQHVAYFRRVRPPTFGAFLETAGWLILLLVALGALGGLADPGTRRVELASAAVGLACVVAGRSLLRRGIPRDR